MKIKSNYILRNIAGQYVVVPIGERLIDFNGLINLNETGAFLWELLKNDTDSEILLKKLLDEYDIDEETAKTDIALFIKKLSDGDVLEI